MTFDDLPDKQQKFVEFYCDLGDRDEAYRIAGYSVQGRGWKMNARKMFKKLEHIIEIRVETRIGEDSLLALTIIRNLMTSAKSESIRLKAAQYYRERGGGDRIKEVRHTVTVTQELTDEQLDQEIKALSAGVFVESSKSLQ